MSAKMVPEPTGTRATTNHLMKQHGWQGRRAFRLQYPQLRTEHRNAHKHAGLDHSHPHMH